jgi:hypothetical protein
MAQIKKINIKGVEYDLAGSGSSTTDTAYVDNKTLYIEEGTTAGGGGSENNLEIDLLARPLSTNNMNQITTDVYNLIEAFVLDDGFSGGDVFTFVLDDITEEEQTNLLNGNYDNIIFGVNNNGKFASILKIPRIRRIELANISTAEPKYFGVYGFDYYRYYTYEDADNTDVIGKYGVSMNVSFLELSSGILTFNFITTDMKVQNH